MKTEYGKGLIIIIILLKHKTKQINRNHIISMAHAYRETRKKKRQDKKIIANFSLKHI